MYRDRIPENAEWYNYSDWNFLFLGTLDTSSEVIAELPLTKLNFYSYAHYAAEQATTYDLITWWKQQGYTESYTDAITQLLVQDNTGNNYVRYISIRDTQSRTFYFAKINDFNTHFTTALQNTPFSTANGEVVLSVDTTQNKPLPVVQAAGMQPDGDYSGSLVFGSDVYFLLYSDKGGTEDYTTSLFKKDLSLRDAIRMMGETLCALILPVFYVQSQTSDIVSECVKFDIAYYFKTYTLQTIPAQTLTHYRTDKTRYLSKVLNTATLELDEAGTIEKQKAFKSYKTLEYSVQLLFHNCIVPGDTQFDGIVYNERWYKSKAPFWKILFIKDLQGRFNRAGVLDTGTGITMQGTGYNAADIYDYFVTGGNPSYDVAAIDINPVFSYANDLAARYFELFSKPTNRTLQLQHSAENHNYYNFLLQNAAALLLDGITKVYVIDSKFSFESLSYNVEALKL